MSLLLRCNSCLASPHTHPSPDQSGLLASARQNADRGLDSWSGLSIEPNSGEDWLDRNTPAVRHRSRSDILFAWLLDQAFWRAVIRRKKVLIMKRGKCV